MSQKKILVIEDSAELADSLEDMRNFKGYQAIKAVAGVPGLTMALEEKPDLILLDLKLPDIDGFEFKNALFFIIGYYFKVYSYDVFASFLSLFIIIGIFVFGENTRSSVSSLGTTFFMISFLKAIYNKISTCRAGVFFSYLGKNTLIIVLLHPVFLNFFKIIQFWFFKIDSTLIFYSILNTSFTIVLSLFTAFILDKTDLSRFVFGRNIYFAYGEN